MLLLLACHAFAAEQTLYERALGVIGANYLRQPEIDERRMFIQAAEQLERQIEWLIVTPDGDSVHLQDGAEKWHATVTLGQPSDLAAALGRLETAIRSSPSPVDADVDVRVELLKGVVRTLDRHSAVLHGEGLERFDERLSGTLTGVGFTLSRDDTGLFVKDLVPRAAAERAGVLRQDRLTQIDGVSTTGMGTDDATDRIRGAAGSTVVLTLLRGDTSLDIHIQREKIVLPNVEASVGPGGVGVVRIDHFTERTKSDLVEALAELGADGLKEGLIIDLRGNTGGSLGQSAQAADVFVSSGLIVSTAGHTGRPVPGLIAKIEALADSPGYEMPIVVLQDRATASGSEILGGALAELGRAVLVGERSFGKGTVQKLYPLEADLKLKLTVAEYVLAGDTHVADVGLSPDLALDTVEFNEDGVWYPAPERTPDAVRIIDGDRALAIAAALLGTTTGPDRADLLNGIAGERERIASEEQRAVFDRLRTYDVDWSRGPAPDGPVAVDVTWAWSSPPAAGQTSTLTATVVNRGAALHQAALRLRSTNETFDEVILPIGGLAEGETRAASATFKLARGVEDRADRVEQRLEAFGADPVELPSQRVATLGAALPVIAVSLRARAPDADGVTRVSVDLGNRTDRVLSGLTARFDFPKVDGIELREPRTDPKSLPPRESDRVELGLQIAPTWTADSLPLHLIVTDDSGARLADHDVELPRNGRMIRLEAPQIAVARPPIELPLGATRLQIRATDDRALDHVVVYAGTETMSRVRARPAVTWDREKLAWKPAHGRALTLDIEVPVVSGTNRYTIVARDKDGLKTVRDVYVLGEEGPTTAEAISPPAKPTTP